MDIQQTLQDNVVNDALSLAANVFPGPVQDAITLYLNGATFNLGDGVTFSVAPQAGQVTIQATPVAISGTSNSATVTLTGSGEYSGATITATFTDNGNDGVTVDVAISSGSTLDWVVSSLWPSMLGSTVFNNLKIGDVDLDLTTTFNNGSADIDFEGSATVSYKGQPAVSGMLKLVLASAGGGGGLELSFLAGIVVPSWTPGSLWSALSPLAFLNSGAVFSSISTGDVPLSALIDPTKVPAIQDPNFKIQSGLSFFTTLQLTTGSVQILQTFLPSDLLISLYANLATDLSSATVIAASPTFTKGSFTFNGLQLEWDMQSETNQTISLSIGGTYLVDTDQQLTLTATATIATTGNATITVALQDWEEPFGYQNLIVQDFEVDIICGTDGGITVELGGSFEFGNDEVGQFTCTVGGAITDFEDPSALVFELQDQTPGKALTLGLVIDEITTVDVQSIPVIQVIDDVFQFQDLGFWVVEIESIVINGKTYYQGFGIAADFTIFGEQVTLNVDVQEPTGGTPSFSGLAQLGTPLQFGSVLTLSAASDPTKGPDLSVSSTGSPYYFYVDAYVAFLDIIQVSMLGQATDNGFQLTYTVQAGQQSSQGSWLNQQVTVLVDKQQLIFNASLSFAFSFDSVTLGPFSIAGVEVIAQATQPLTVSAALNLGASVPQAQININGNLTFDFENMSWNPSFAVTLDIGTVIQSLSDVGKQVVAWLESNAESIFAALCTDVNTFIQFVEANFDSFSDSFLDICKILHQQFSKLAEDIVTILDDIGYSASQIVAAIVNEFQMAPQDAISLVDQILDSGGCSAQTAGGLLTGASTLEISHFAPTARVLMGRASIDLMTSPGGQALLKHYYKNQPEIDRLLRTNQAVQDTVNRVLREALDERRRRRGRHIEDVPKYVEQVLESLRAAGSPPLKASVSAILRELSLYRGLNYDQFLSALNGEVPSAK